jgi:hypothetical protein
LRTERVYAPPRLSDRFKQRGRASDARVAFFAQIATVTAVVVERPRRCAAILSPDARCAPPNSMSFFTCWPRPESWCWPGLRRRKPTSFHFPFPVPIDGGISLPVAYTIIGPNFFNRYLTRLLMKNISLRQEHISKSPLNCLTKRISEKI